VKIGWKWSVLAATLALVLGAASAQTSSSSSAAPQAPKKQTVAQKIAADQDKLDINSATAAQLKALPGMGDEYVARIIAGRPYTAKNQLVQRGILPQTAYAGISDKIIAHRPRPN